MAEHRATVRVPLRLMAEVSRPPGQQWLPVETVDISPVGAGIVASADWAVGATIGFRCELPDRQGTVALDVTGEIRWRAEPAASDGVLARDLLRYGIQFDPLPPRLEDRIVGAIFFVEASRPR